MITNLDLNKVVDYLDKYHGKKYIDPDKVEGTRKEYYIEFREAGQTARDEFRNYCNDVCERISELEMDSGSPSMWINQGQNVNEYFWSRYKTKSHDGYVNNIAITINRPPQLNDSWTLGVYVGASYTKAGGKECIRQNRLLDLDIPISDNIYYVVKTTNDAEYIIKNRDEVRKRYDEGKVMVVSLLKVIEGPYTEERYNEILDDTVNSINEFIPYYEYVMSGEHSEEEWKSKPTTIVKPEVPSVDWEKEYPIGCQIEHPKFGVGEISGYDETNIFVRFEDFGEKKLSKDACASGHLLSLV